MTRRYLKHYNVRYPAQVEPIRMVRFDENVEKRIGALGKRVDREVFHHRRSPISIFLKKKLQ